MRSLVLLVACFCFAQTSAQSIREWNALAEEAMDQEDWYAVTHYYLQAFELDSSSFGAAVNYAEALRHIKEYRRAAYYYEKAYNKDRGKLFAEGQFWMAVMQQQSGEYTKALRNFKKYQKKVRREKDSYAYKRCAQGIEGCTFALNARRDASWVDVINVGAPLNTPQSEYAPWLLTDSTVWLTAMYQDVAGEKPLHKLYSSSLSNDSTWAESNPWSFGSWNGHEGNACMSPDGNRVYFVRCETPSECQIWAAEKEGDHWADPEVLSSVNKPGYTSTMPHVADVDGKQVLFYASNRPGGEGGLDIWWSELNNGIPSPAVNAGRLINSPDDEVSPFYLNNYLYFSSTWWPGFGGFDIFRSAGKQRSFGPAENMEYPMNSAANDLYYRYFPALDRGMFASNRVGSQSGEWSTCCNDLYTLQFPDSIAEEGVDSLRYATLADLNRYLPVTLYFHNDEPDNNSWDTTSTVDYLTSYEGYKKLENVYVKESIKGLSQEEKENAEFEVEEFFDFYVEKGRGDLDIFMPLLLQELEVGTSVNLRVRGFASPRANSDYNVNLTKRRIHSLERDLRRFDQGALLPYLKGTSENQALLTLTAVPYGEYEADQTVSDALSDEKESIYSRGARLERKIVVESVERLPDRTPEPEITLDRLVHDFGVISDDFPVSRTILISNTGSDTLHIMSVQADCGCTVADISKDILAPGEQAELLVTFDPKDKSGLVSKQIRIATNAGTEPEVITITADIRPN